MAVATFGHRNLTTGSCFMKPITPREMKILELIGQGYSSGQIATSLGISAHTVDGHRKKLLIKFNVKNAAELVQKAIQTNALDILSNPDSNSLH